MGVKRASFPSLALAMPLILTAIFAVQAQDYRARVQGVVSDPTQAAVSAAKVTLKNVNTGIENVKTTDATGAYVFDLVPPGTYSVAAEAAGFNRFVQEKVEVLTRGDVTVNMALKLGDVAQTVTVSESANEIQFTTSTMAQTVDGKMLDQLPVLARNPFTLALLDPAVVNDYWDVEHRNPFYMWSSDGLNVGGDTAGHNDMLLDGIPLGVGSRGSYMPAMDAVQEVAVQQNSVDAEFGFSGGGTLNVSMKSGTNDFHGTGYYFGRNPKLNALANRVDRSPNPIRNHIWGGTVGGPILKNKLFFFQTYEQWKTTQPTGTVVTLPTAAEKTGDFSGARTPGGALRPIYDPFSTKFDSASQTVTRTPFPGNIIPAQRIDPTGQAVINDLWAPNNAGDDPSGVNNYRKTYAWWIKYWNISNRVDYNVNEKWRMYTRFSKYETRLDNPNYGGTIAVRSDNGGIMDAMNAGADVIYQATPNTVLDLRYGAIYVEDDYDSNWAKVGAAEWAKLWPNSNWYKPVLSVLGNNIYYPNFYFSGMGYASTGIGGWWVVHERQHNYQINLSHDHGKHHLKFGQTLRYNYEQNAGPGPGSFSFNAADTANTFLKPDITQSGDPYATLLLGGVSDGNAGINNPFDVHSKQWAAYVQDDLKLTRRITLNLGLRYEYETSAWEENNYLSRYLDLSNPIPEMQSNPPNIPANIASLVKGGYKFNGAWLFTDSKHRGIYNPNPHIFLPRVGIAVRINDKTAIRAGWARYAVPILTLHPEAIGYLPFDGFSRSTSVAPLVSGKPTVSISDPFPAAHPVLLPKGKSLGRYQNLGDGATWFYQNLTPPVNDRFNFSVQRTLPFNILLDSTFFMNFGRKIIPNGPGTMWGTGGFQNNLNMMDPNLAYTLKGEIDKSVSNPFFNYLTPETFPGSLRNQETVSESQLLRPYPQYGWLSERFIPGFHSHYGALQIRAQRSFRSGLSFSLGYNYNHGSTQEWFNDDAHYADVVQSTQSHAVVSHSTWIRDVWPRHRMSVAGTWDLPIGKGQKYLSHMHPVLDAIIGGWSTSQFLLFNSGSLLDFSWQQLIAPTSTPKVYRKRNGWFDTSGFALAEPYTPRTNPWRYPDLAGPRYWNLDSTLVKYFPIKERTKLEFRIEAYNSPNHFIPTYPELNINSGNFGKSTNQQNYGRQIQYTARIHF
ncbi:MAG: carboxypeptidase regulatory-like domain-containing protein [Acidobacteria bacterium]|nr:MAG: carboxypeptidase regulatory-like domain-containing protein [Acidobacteriota bacterium]